MSPNPVPQPEKGDHRVKYLETIAGVVVGVISLLILLVGALFAVGSFGRYLKARSM